MSVSGGRTAVDIDLDDFEKRLRAAGAPAGVEDPLAELARLVEASRPKVASAAPPPPAPPPRQATPRPLAPGELRAAFEAPAEAEFEPEIAAPAEAGLEESEPGPESASAPAREPGRRPRRWLLTVSGLAIAGVAMIGAVVALKGGLPGLHKQPPFIVAAVGPTKVQPPSDETVSSANEAGTNLLRDNTQANRVKVVNNEEQPVDLNAQTAAASNGGGQPLVRGTVDTPVVVAAPQPSPAAASPFPEPKPVRTISLRPDGTPIPSTGAGADAQASQTPPAQPATQAPKPPAKSAAKAPPVDAANAQSSTPKLDVPAKLSGKSSARVAVAKTDTTAPGGAGEAAGEPAGAKAEKPTKAKTQEAAAEPAAPADAAEPGATASGGWAVQLAAPRSEAEAKNVVSKLAGKYASALGGSALGVHKATVNGETIYRVRVTGLSKADAAALCARLKGGGGQCFVTK